MAFGPLPAAALPSARWVKYAKVMSARWLISVDAASVKVTFATSARACIDFSA